MDPSSGTTGAVKPLRVIVCDDQPIVREGVAQILRDAGFDVLATTGDADELVRKARAHRPDVVVTDICPSTCNGGGGLRAAQIIRQELSETAVLVLSQGVATQETRELVGDRASGIGYLVKQHVVDLSTLTDAVRRVAGGGSALDPAVVEHLAAHGRAAQKLSRLTPKEQRVLALMAAGCSNKAIAEELVVTVAAVERHVTRIFNKLELHQTADQHRRVLAVLHYLRD